MTARREWLGLSVFLAACLAVAGFGGMVTRTSVGDWYVALRKPTWTPPAWLFGPVWSVLYATMAVAAWLVWARPGPRRPRTALAAFGVQLALNAGWTGLFFGLRQPGWALAEVVVLWAAIGATVVLFWRVRAAWGAVMLPYWAWVTFASALNFAIWRLNS